MEPTLFEPSFNPLISRGSGIRNVACPIMCPIIYKSVYICIRSNPRYYRIIVIDKLKLSPYHYSIDALFSSLQIPCVIVPIGQKLHHVLGLYNAITISPISVDVSIRL